MIPLYGRNILSNTLAATDNSMSKYTWFLTVICFFIMNIIFGAAYSFGVFFKPMVDEFSWTRAVTSGPFSLSMIVYGVSSYVTGRLSDKFGARVIVTFGGVFIGLGCLLMSLTGSLWQLYIFYGLLAGLAQGFTYIPLVAMMARWAPQRRAFISGIIIAGIGLGIAIVPPIAAALTQSYGWRRSLVIVGAVSLVLVTVLAQFLKKAPAASPAPVKANQPRLPRVEYSLREASRTRNFLLFSFAWVMYGLCLQVATVHIVPYSIGLGMSAVTAAGVLSAIGFVGVFGRVSIGFAGDRFTSRRVAMVGFLLIAIAYAGLSIFNAAWMLYVFAALYGFCSGLGLLLTPLAADLFGTKALGAVTGTLLGMFSVGAAIGPWAAGYLFDIMGDYRLAFLLSGIISAIAAISLLPVKRPH